jgi:hypothetical protein
MLDTRDENVSGAVKVYKAIEMPRLVIYHLTSSLSVGMMLDCWTTACLSSNASGQLGLGALRHQAENELGWIAYACTVMPVLRHAFWKQNR